MTPERPRNLIDEERELREELDRLDGELDRGTAALEQGGRWVAFLGGTLLMLSGAASLIVAVTGSNDVIATWRAPALAAANGVALGILIAGLTWDRDTRSGAWLRLPGLIAFTTVVMFAVIGVFEWDSGSTFESGALALRAIVIACLLAMPFTLAYVYRNPGQFRGPWPIGGVAYAIFLGAGVAMLAVAANRWIPISDPEVREYTVTSREQWSRKSTKWLIGMADANGNSVEHIFHCPFCADSLKKGRKFTFTMRRGLFGYEYFTDYAPVRP